MNTDRRVVITGLGVVTPIGNDLETYWDNLRNGVSGIGRIQAFDTSAFDCQIAGEIRDFDLQLREAARAMSLITSFYDHGTRMMSGRARVLNHPLISARQISRRKRSPARRLGRRLP